MNHIDFSAFGSTEPLYDRGGERIRWFCPWYVDEPAAIERALDMLATLESEVKASRITVRLFSRGALAEGVMDILARRGFKTEARMAVADSRGGVITYVAQCLPERYSDPVDVHSEEAMLAAIMARPRKGGAAITEAFQQLNDFRVETVNPDTLSHADTARLVTLHHSIYCNEWAIHSGSRADLMNNNMNLCHREKHFLAEFRDVGMQEYAQVFQKIYERIGLDVFGIDLALVNGKILIFEANACMSFVGKRHGTDEQYGYLDSYLTAIRRALKRMLIKA